MAVALDIMSQVKDKDAVSEEVYKYAAAGMLDDGIVLGVGPLSPSNKYIASRIGSARQDTVRREMGRKGQEYSVQAMRSVSIKDFVEDNSRALLSQLKVIFP